jgi:adenosylmethionine-8-amino-7-oxononanoate aminotransferase
VIVEARKHGLIIRPLGNVIVIMPPLAISIEEIDRICEITYDAIRKVTGGLKDKKLRRSEDKKLREDLENKKLKENKC